jgi:hypothetical protein
MVYSKEEAEDGALAGPGLANEPYILALHYRDVYVIENGSA